MLNRDHTTHVLVGSCTSTCILHLPPKLGKCFHLQKQTLKRKQLQVTHCIDQTVLVFHFLGTAHTTLLLGFFLKQTLTGIASAVAEFQLFAQSSISKLQYVIKQSPLKKTFRIVLPYLQREIRYVPPRLCSAWCLHSSVQKNFHCSTGSYLNPALC